MIENYRVNFVPKVQKTLMEDAFAKIRNGNLKLINGKIKYNNTQPQKLQRITLNF
jgi:hypothetical protein